MNQKTAEMREAIRVYAYHNVAFFAKYFLKDYCTLSFNPVHRYILRKDMSRGRVRVVAAPRSSAKTTILCMVDTLHDIVYSLEDFILFVSETGPIGDDRVRDLRDEIEFNERIQEIYGDFRGSKWVETDIMTSNDIRVTSRGRGKQVRGLIRRGNRPSRVIVDDLESKDSVRSPVQRQKTWQWIMQDLLRVGRADGTTNFDFIGTYRHQDAALPKLAERPAYESKVFKAVISWSKRQDLWDEWKNIYSDLEDEQREENAFEYYLQNEKEMMEGVKCLWPESGMINYYAVMEAIVNEGRFAVNSEFQNEPHDPETQIFDMRNAGWFTIEGNPGEEIVKTQKGIKNLNQMRKCVFLDPALGSESGVSFACVAALAIDDKRYAYVLDLWMEKVPPSRQVVQTFDMAERWDAKVAGLETNLFRDYMEKDFKAERERRKRDGKFWKIDIKPINQSKNKEDRISTLEPNITNGWLLFNRYLPEEAIRSFEQFPTAAINDAPDAVEGAYRLLERPTMKAKKASMGSARAQRRRGR